MKSHTALVVCGGGFQGLGLIKALRAVAGTRVLVLDLFEENVARYFADAFFQAPPLSQASRFIEYTLRLCQSESVNTVFAATSLELELLAQHRVAFSAINVILLVSDSKLLQLAADKLALYRWLGDEGLSHMPFFTSARDPAANYPLIGKPRNGWGGRNLKYIESRQEALAMPLNESAAFVWQPLLSDFDEYSIDCAVDTVGRISPLSFRRRVRMLGGFAILGECGAPDNVRALAQACLVRLVPLGARGPLNLQILSQGAQGWVSDLNPRAGTSMPLSLVAGLNPIAFLLNGNAGKLHDPNPGPKARSLRYLEEHYIHDLRLEDVRGVVFDLDDTLFDQKAWMLAKLKLTWSEVADRLPPRKQFLTLALRVIEEGNRAHLFDALANELGWDDVTRLSVIECYRRARPSHAPIYPDVVATLHQLRRLGYRLALLTDNPATSQRLKLDVCGLGELFDAVVFTDELGASKPDSRGFDACGKALGISAGQLVMVGDNLFRDIQGAQNAGYQHGFLICRNGAFFNFSPELARAAGLDLAECTTLNGLSELFWHLRGVVHEIKTRAADTTIEG